MAGILRSRHSGPEPKQTSFASHGQLPSRQSQLSLDRTFQKASPKPQEPNFTKSRLIAPSTTLLSPHPYVSPQLFVLVAIMATELTVQSERAFQKQPHIFLNHKSKAARSKRVGKGGRRWYKDIGLGYRTPKTAIEGTYIGTKKIKQLYKMGFLQLNLRLG